jgi:hypothetical protein
MQIQIVKKDESIEFIINDKFIYCKELKKGFVKKDLSALNIDDYSFENVSNIIEGLDYQTISSLNVDSVTFGDNYSDHRGEILISQKVEEKLKVDLVTIDADLQSGFIENRRQLRRYFDIDDLTTDTVSDSSQMIV